MADDFLTVAEIAQTLKLNQQTVRNWIDAGKLPALHIGRRVRIRRSDFDELIASGYSGRANAMPGPRGARDSIWDGRIPPPQLP